EEKEAEAKQQYTLAEQHRLRAEKNFHTARHAVKKLLREVGQDWLDGVPHMTQTRKALLEKALEFHEGFLEQRSDDPLVRYEAGQAYQEVGDIYKMLRRFDDAQKAYKHSIDLLTSLARQFPMLSDYRIDLAAGYAHLGLLLRDHSRFEPAEEAYKE